MGDHVFEVAPLEALNSGLVNHPSFLLQEILTFEDCSFVSLVRHHHIVAEHYAESAHRDRLAISKRLEGQSYYCVALLCLWSEEKVIECLAFVLFNTVS